MNELQLTVEAIECANDAIRDGTRLLAEATELESERRCVRETLASILPSVRFADDGKPLLPDHIGNQELALEVYARVHGLEGVLNDLVTAWDDPDADIEDVLEDIVKQARDVLESDEEGVAGEEACAV